MVSRRTNIPAPKKDKMEAPPPRDRDANGEELFCLCKRPYDERRFMIGYAPCV